MSPAAPPRFGAVPMGDGTTAFSVWAPGAEALRVAIDGAAAAPMQRDADGWHRATLPCGPGARYCYEFSSSERLPDPASRFQPLGVHGPSEVVDTSRFEWTVDWRGRPWHESVIYEMHAGLCGGWSGVRERLPQLAELGITVMELMPIAASAGARNWGYDGVMPYAPHAALGTPQELQQMIDAAHGLGLSVHLDVVYNHLGPDGNYLARYAPGFFRADIHTPWGPAIDFRRAEVREFFIANAIYWLDEYRFDGLRLDAVHAIHDDTFLPELARRVRESVGADRHVHLVLENEHNDARLLTRGFDAQWNDDAHNALHVLLTGERESYYANYADAPARHLARCLAEGFAYQGEPSPTHQGKPRGTLSAALPPTAFVFFLQNHDQVGNRAQGERLTVLADAHALRAAVALQLLCPQVPLLFMGVESGARTPFLYFTDFHDALAEQVREGRRSEFAAFAAYADAEARARIPDPNDAETFERSRLTDENDRCRAEYRELLRLRREAMTPRLRGTHSLGAFALGSHAVRAAWRLGDGATLTLLANFGDEAVQSLAPDAPLLHATDDDVARLLAQGILPPRSCAAFCAEAAP